MVYVSEDSLVLYKNRPARVSRTGEKIEIILEDGKKFQVRFKDVQLLHPGPLRSLAELKPVSGDVETAWELLAGTTTELPELADLVYGSYSPATAWATWQLVADGLYFRGTPEAVEARPAEVVAQERASRAARQAEEQAWTDFVARIQVGRVIPADERYLAEVVDVALNRRDRSRVLQELGREQTPINAHALLLTIGYWDEKFDPYPLRFGAPVSPPDVALPPLPPEDRRDLTHLPAFAIDDVGNRDPDDALSLEPGRLWVHVADAAALVPPDSPADLEARSRGASLYLPEGTVPMLPFAAVAALGLGLEDVSPALSFGLDLDETWRVTGLEITPSWVRVQRLTYDEVETRLTEAPFHGLDTLARLAQERRTAGGAVMIDLPEVKIWVEEGRVSIRPLLPLRSRELVTEAMLLCGEALAGFALQAGLPIPFITQPPPSTEESFPGLAGMFAKRRAMRPSRRGGEPGSHAGLGLALYTQATSPLRRYADLLVHQQVRAFLAARPPLDAGEILARLGAAEAVGGSVRQAERLARRHWTLVYLHQHPDWQGEGILVERHGSRGLLLIPELDLETWLYVPDSLPLNGPLRLALESINLPALEAYFRAAG